MLTLSLVLDVLALVCFALAALGVSTRVNMIAAGLFCWLLGSVVHL